MAKSGASKGAKKIKPFDEQKTSKAAGQKVASNPDYIPVGTDRHFPSDGPGSLLDRRDADYDDYPSDKKYPSGTFPLAKKKKKKKTRTA